MTRKMKFLPVKDDTGISLKRGFPNLVDHQSPVGLVQSTKACIPLDEVPIH